MKLLSKLKSSVRKSLVLGTVAAAVMGGSVFALGSSNTTTATTASPSSSSSATSVTNDYANCDANAVVYCGATTSSELQQKYASGDGVNSAASIQTIYGSFGITSADVAQTAAAGVNGYVTSGGDVYVGSKLVATNALTAGREDIDGSASQYHDVNGVVWYTRPPSVSFLNSSLSAFVVLNSNGQFVKAMLTSCGNPVSATNVIPTPPTPKPNYTINKQVEVLGKTDFDKTISVKPGTKVEYKITVSSTGNAPVTNVTVKDNLPNNVDLIKGSLDENGHPYGTNDFFGKGIVIPSLANGKDAVFTFDALVDPTNNVETCKAEVLNNVGTITSTGLPPMTSTATIKKYCLPKPVYACTDLSDNEISRTEFSYTVRGEAKNEATIKGYKFDLGDGVSKTVTTNDASYTLKYTYANVGTRKTVAYAIVDVAGTTKDVTSAACEKTVTIKAAPVAECTDLTLKQNASNPLAVTATATISTKNGAKLSDISFNWGDSSAATNNGTKLAADHTYAKSGTYNVVATLTFSPTSIAKSTCQAPVTITTPTPSAMPTCGELYLNVNNDDETVSVAGLTYTANSATYEYTTLDWGDSSAIVSASDITGQSHTYSGTGPFTVIATPYFSVNGQVTAVPGANCEQKVSFTTTPTPPVTPIVPVTPSTPPAVTTAVVTPVAPTALVNTGPGSVIALFAFASTAGAIAYRFFLSRRLGRE